MIFFKERFLIVIILGIFGVAQQSNAAAEMHLRFHSAVEIDEQSFVRGSLINRGDADLAHGFVVITLLDARCRPLKSVLHSFDRIVPGQEQSFLLPVAGRLRHYRLLSFTGFDDKGFNVLTVDDNAEIYKLREPEERALCAQARSQFGEGSGRCTLGDCKG